MSALAYDVIVTGPRGGKSVETLWANSADQAARRVCKDRGVHLSKVHVSDRNKKVDA